MASEADRQAAVYLYRRIRQKSILRPMPSEMESMIADAIAEARAEGYRAGLEAARQQAEYEEKRLAEIMNDPEKRHYEDLYQAMSIGAGKAMRRIRALINSTDSPAGETGRGEA